MGRIGLKALAVAVLWLAQAGLIAQTASTPTVQFPTVADMVAARIPAVANRLTALVSGRVSTNDGGGGTFFYDSSSAASTNLGTVFKPTASAGRWLRQYSGALNVKWFGATGDGVTDDTASISNTIAHAESIYPDWGTPVRSPSTDVYFPTTTVGRYLISSTITVTKPLTIFGDNGEVAAIQATTVTPVFTIAYSGFVNTYRRATIRGLSLYGNWNGSAAVNGQHGIHLTSAGGVIVENCDISYMGGCGFLSDFEGNSNWLVQNRIISNSDAGIRLSGTFNSACLIKNNLIELNRIGIDIAPDPGEYITTGNIEGNLIESNTSGSGTIGSSGRPSVGIRLERVQRMNIIGNYFEQQMNELYFVTNVSFCLIKHNVGYFANSNLLPETYGGPPPRQMGFLYVGGSSVQNEISENNIVEFPAKPVTTSDADWGTGTFGATYEHITDSQGVNRYVRNLVQTPSEGDVTITNPSNRHTIVNVVQDASDASGRAILTEKLWKRLEIFAGHSITNDASGNTISTGNLGLSTLSNPQTRLHIRGTGVSGGIRVGYEVAGQTYVDIYRASTGDAPNIQGGLGVGTAGNLSLQASGGNLGVGDATPASLLTVGNGDLFQVTSGGQVILATAGQGIRIKEGSNARMGTATLVNGTVTVNNTSVTANTRIFLTRAVEAGTTVGILGVGTVVAATSFVIESVDLAGALSADDDSTVNWLLIEPSP